jgi:hypothetical protein
MSTQIPFKLPYSQGYQTAISRGDVVRAIPFSAYGRRTTTGAESNILWPDGVYALPPAIGIQLSVVSTSANDTAAGTGIRTVDIHYLDANLVEQTETVTMNGVTPVLTIATNIRFVQCMHMNTYGSGKVAAGTITAGVGAQNYSEIFTGKVRCSSSVRMVPAGKRMLVDTVYAGSASGAAAASVIVELVTCHFDDHDYTADSIFFPLGAAAFQDSSGGITFSVPIIFTEGMTFGFRFETDKAATITGFWSGWLEDATN